METKMRTLAPWYEFRPLLMAQEPFRCYGNMHAVKVDSDRAGLGCLDPVQAAALSAALSEREVDYIVYSYATPIAWHFANGRWCVPGVYYSAITSRHQSRIRAALHDSVGVEHVIRNWPVRVIAS